MVLLLVWQALLIGVQAVLLISPWARRHWRGRQPRRFGSVLYLAALTTIWALQDFGVIPTFVGMLATAALVVGLQFLPGDDDDNRRDRRHRAAAWKRVKQWLAAGTPAVRPEVR